ncbi:MAG: hypothetical protein ACLSHC_16230 [Bilophila wadsworthia]
MGPFPPTASGMTGVEGRVDDARLAELLAANSEFIESSKVIMAKLFTAVEDANSVIS